MGNEESLAKLIALNHNLAKFLRDPRGRFFDPKYTMDLFHRYEKIRGELINEHPRLFSDLPIRDMPQPSGTTDYDGRGYIERADLVILNNDIEYCIDILFKIAEEVPQIAISEEGIFFAGQHFDAILKAKEILSRAKKRVVVIDGYIDTKVLDLLSAKKDQVVAWILTKGLRPDVKAAAEAFNKQYGKLIIKTSDAFHDRFIIIDDSKFYHFGASIKDLGKRGFMFSCIEEMQIISDLTKMLGIEWANATQVV